VATTRFAFGPLGAEFPSTNFPQLTISHTTSRRPALAYDATTKETAHWTAIAPQGLTGTMTAIITYAMVSAVANGVAFDVAVEAITDNDATDTDAATSFDTDNTANETVPATAGYISQLSVTLTTQDSIAAGDYFRLSVARDPADAADTATGDCLVLAVELRDAA